MDNIQGISQQSIDAIKGILAGGGFEYLPNGVKKDISTSTGLTAFNLEPAARLLVPAYSPLRNRIPRVQNTKGGLSVNWKVITSLDTAKAAIFTAEGTKASTVQTTVASKSGNFGTISLGDFVNFRAQWAGRTFEDVKARAVARLLKTGIIREEQGLLGGRLSALGAVTTPTSATATTGGTIAAATYNVFVRAVTYLAGSGAAAKGRFSSAASQVTTGSTSTISASVPWVEGAGRYEWYVGTAGNEKLEATTQINSVLLTALAGTGVTQASVAAADTSNGADANAFNGILAQLDGTANFNITLATGTAGTGTQLALAIIDNLLQNMWDTYRVDPDVLYVNSDQSIALTNLVLAAAGAPTLYVTNDPAQKSSITGGYRVTHYLSKVTGKAIPVETHPYLPAGTMMFNTFEMPFSASDIDNPIEVETLQDWMQLDYPMTAPRWDFEVLLDEVVKIYFPGANATIRNIAPHS